MTSRWDVQFYNCQKLQSYEVTSRRLAKLRGNIQASGTDLDFVVNHLVYYGMWRWYPVHEAFQFPCFPFEPNIVVKYVALDLAWYLKLGRDPIIPSLIQTYPLYCSFPLFPADNGHHIIFGLSLFPADFPSFLQTFRLPADFPSGLNRTSPISCRQWPSHNIWTFPFSCRLPIFPADFPPACRLPVYTAEVSFFLQTFPISCRFPAFLQTSRLYYRSFLFPADFFSYLHSSRLYFESFLFPTELPSFLQTSRLYCKSFLFPADFFFYLHTSLL